MVKEVYRNFIVIFLILLKNVDIFAEEKQTGWQEAADSRYELERPQDEPIGPFENVFAGIYTNFKSTYLGNQTATEYLKGHSLIRTHVGNSTADIPKKSKKSNKSKKHRTRKKKRVNRNEASRIYDPLMIHYDEIKKYELGPDVNVSLDMSREIVSINIDEEYVKDILTGNWIADSEGRRKKGKGSILMKILPLFILPFLIQSSIIPFLVTKLKLLLIKSIVIGKLAIFLLVVSAIKNSQKISSYESIPTYYGADHPSRRSEGVPGYRVEGRPTAWVT